jgi:ABC-type phosphate transport system substrate-binding protein
MSGNSSSFYGQRPPAPQPAPTSAPAQPDARSQPPHRPAPLAEKKRGSSLGLGLLVFIGSLLGTLIGVAADFGDAADTVARIQEAFYPQLCVAGSDTILGESLGYSGAIASAFEQRINASPTSRVRVSVDAIGSVNGVRRAVEGDCVDVLASSEPIQPISISELTGAGISIDCAAEIGYDVVAFVTDINNPIPNLNRRNLTGILTGAIRNWAELNRSYEAPIRILFRPGSGTTDFVLRNVARHENPFNPPPAATYLPCGSNEDCLNQTLANRGTLYWVSTAWMRTQPERYLRVLPILSGDEQAFNPLTDDISLNDYPAVLIRPLYMYVLRRPGTTPEVASLGQRFLEYVRSVEGQQILEAHHFYTYFAQPRDVSVPLPPGFETDATGHRVICRTPA